MLWSQSSTDL